MEVADHFLSSQYNPGHSLSHFYLYPYFYHLTVLDQPHLVILVFLFLQTSLNSSLCAYLYCLS